MAREHTNGGQTSLIGLRWRTDAQRRRTTRFTRPQNAARKKQNTTTELPADVEFRSKIAATSSKRETQRPQLTCKNKCSHQHESGKPRAEIGHLTWKSSTTTGAHGKTKRAPKTLRRDMLLAAISETMPRLLDIVRAPPITAKLLKIPIALVTAAGSIEIAGASERPAARRRAWETELIEGQRRGAVPKNHQR